MIWLLLAAFVVLAFPGRRVGVVASRLRSRRALVHSAELAEICDLAAISLTGGLNIATSLRIAAEAAGGPIAGELEKILAIARIDGLQEAMATAGGGGVRLYQAVNRAGATGGPMLQSVQALADELWAEHATVAVEKARKLPVAMLLPLTLLILPGFLLLAVAPGVLDALSRLSF
jgi:pilus assembly protein TadC